MRMPLVMTRTSMGVRAVECRDRTPLFLNRWMTSLTLNRAQNQQMEMAFVMTVQWMT